MVNESLSLDSRGSLSLKVLTVTCLFAPSISLYNSQYRFVYNQRVSPLPIFIDNRASIGWGARLQVINHAPNA